MSIPPINWQSGEVLRWTTKERCEAIVAEWVRQGSKTTFRISPAREDRDGRDAPEWAHMIEAKS